MLTEFGREAKPGDYVLVGFGDKHGKTQAVPAYVCLDGKVEKAYTNSIYANQSTWVRKVSCIIVVDPSIISDEDKKQIQDNIEAATVKDIGDWTKRNKLFY